MIIVICFVLGIIFMHFLTSSNPPTHPPTHPILVPKMCMLFLICLDLYIALNAVIYSCKIYIAMDEIDLLVSKKKKKQVLKFAAPLT